jgi:hypothetical protein
MNKTKIIIMILILVAVSFYAGDMYGKRQLTRNNPAQQFTGMRGRTGSTGRMGGGMIAGTVLSKDATTITITLPDGGSKIIFVSTSTPVTKSVSGVSSDITTGENIVVTGTTNTDGSVSAQSIQIRKLDGTGFGSTRQ